MTRPGCSQTQRQPRYGFLTTDWMCLFFVQAVYLWQGVCRKAPVLVGCNCKAAQVAMISFRGRLGANKTGPKTARGEACDVPYSPMPERRIVSKEKKVTGGTLSPTLLLI